MSTNSGWVVGWSDWALDGPAGKPRRIRAGIQFALRCCGAGWKAELWPVATLCYRRFPEGRGFDAVREFDERRASVSAAALTELTAASPAANHNTMR